MQTTKYYNSIIKSTKLKINTLEKLEDPNIYQLQEYRRLGAELKCAKAQKKQLKKQMLKEDIKKEIMNDLLPLISGKNP